MLKAQNGRKGKPPGHHIREGVQPHSVPSFPSRRRSEIRRAAGKDGEKLFMELHPWVNWDNMLGQCLVGILVSENDAKAKEQHEMEDID